MKEDRKRTPARRASRQAVVLGVLLAAAVPHYVRAGPAKPLIDAPAEIAAQPGEPTLLGVRIVSSDGVPAQALLLFRGLPPSMALSEGQSFSPGVWAAPAAKAENLKVLPPPNSSGKISLNIALVTYEGESLAEAKTTLVVGAGGMGAGMSARPPLSPEERERGLKLLEKGDQGLEGGNVMVARAFYQRAAEMGLAKGALALAATYDPYELTKLKVVGSLQPDVEQAVKWYEKAKELGAEDAASRLQRLANK